jgi:hypothetical protein
MRNIVKTVDDPNFKIFVGKVVPILREKIHREYYNNLTDDEFDDLCKRAFIWKKSIEDRSKWQKFKMWCKNL